MRTTYFLTTTHCKRGLKNQKAAAAPEDQEDRPDSWLSSPTQI